MEPVDSSYPKIVHGPIYIVCISYPRVLCVYRCFRSQWNSRVNIFIAIWCYIEEIEKRIAFSASLILIFYFYIFLFDGWRWQAVYEIKTAICFCDTR